MKRVLIDIARCMGCHSCELACGTAHSAAKDLAAAVRNGEKPPVSVDVVRLERMNFPRHCQHCEDAPCIRGCMSGALYRDEKTGAVICDREKCVGCFMCVMTCPYGAVKEGCDGKAVKCDLCGGEDTPACVKACPTAALTYSEIPEKGAR